ncbi:similar to Saccharomyces cerevisiae YMR261C TPS3 Regulatory subunit of trehalose-6-phosphate synthase/phosphatase complex, which synthesizes the storage carbohydrate trehalose [Maudiozyma barnettii]|uniref:Similar to Saccharomyces cerevisiae YMR261C TPS3 Regulatory subunit of trehalose-6-phosphate synthase/phosphatase complex, which synthesizes the storage carbohydrate trehalose n=1 Tax=Maudiozyma barnettii TaxID=61262 RepID=A0A8H2ZEV7_9SACH|nr:trehalose 6-phosphate synthase/phosphatase complex subunit [Kazachstania barnettii]CAB4252641.1 similar to Saccharomyces cerevisiae YMR261C TPS3 Regulatory subunit of trehalose-6-phosphate synthase/phosphatase complex, which synthesizes the storage carbohydrate trehalose [Kazachstania barnettii]CAD1780113.1 similar to Saccharomyces cerevisiae YMR261C TPS3 Regulatory subunit of trehalose-6-phosphate synthase/phosphatase complex, which synthesizes the storage carbohydrate trehalose [Kazachstania
MTLLVASLYLPYKPQFDVENVENITKDLLKDKHAEEESNTIENIRPINRVISPVGTPYRENVLNPDNLSQDSLILNTEHFKRNQSTTAIDRQVSSEQVMESLTSNAPTNIGSPPPNLYPTNSSVENFFGSSTNITMNRSASPSRSLPPQPLKSSICDDPTESLLKSVNKSLLKHSIQNRQKTGQQQQPSLKRLNSTLKYSSSKIVPTSLPPHIQQIDSDLDDNKSIMNETTYDVPPFGGISNQDPTLKAKILDNSHTLFEDLPCNLIPNDMKGNGSLKNAINSFITQNTMKEFPDDPLVNHVSWIGTMGIATDELSEETIHGIVSTYNYDFNCFPVVTDDTTFRGCYKNYCKQILWPTLHYQIPDNPLSKAFEDHSWKFYQRVNQLFAETLIEQYKPGDTIWIHDYHLMLVPRMVRNKLPTAKIGFFLHISFPSSEVFRCLAHREDILDGLLGANFIGFQVKEYLKHFIQTCSRLLMADTIENDTVIEYQGNFIKIGNIPIGIDALDLQLQLFKDETVKEWRNAIRERWNDTKLIVSRDQFDRVRGLVQKLTAFEKFLLDNPKYIGEVSLIQICIGSSNDENLKKQIAIIGDRINELTVSIGDTPPVVFLYQDLSYEQYLALNSEADLFWVNSQREGMNLSCHEFIASSLEKNAPLLLSEFTGSASELADGSLIINPWDIKCVSEAIKRGIQLPNIEKRSNWKNLLKTIIVYDSDNWIKRNLNSINMSWKANEERSTLFKMNLTSLQTQYNKSEKRFFILKISKPPLARTLDILNELASDKANIVFVLSSFSKSVLEILYNRSPNVGLLAENGAYIRIDDNWYNMADQIDWRTDVIKIFDDKMERLPGSYYKVSDSLVKFHTENAIDKERVKGTIGDIITHINSTFQDKDVHAYVLNDIIYVQQKGLAVQALQFLLNFYNSATMNNETNNNTNETNNVSSVAANFKKLLSHTTKITQPKTDTETKSDNSGKMSMIPIDFMLVAGSSSPILEPIFNVINKCSKNGDFKFGHTITYGRGSVSTFAKEHITGLNELLNSLSRISNS